jgi:hypothetical protein
MIEAPVPILVGITKKEYRELNLSQDEKDSKIWVHLDTGDVTWNNDGMPRPTFYFNNIERDLDCDY